MKGFEKVSSMVTFLETLTETITTKNPKSPETNTKTWCVNGKFAKTMTYLIPLKKS